MPVMCIYRALDVTPETYDKVRETVAWEADPPQGGISHAFGFADDGAVEVNLWESRGDFEAYRDSRLAPVLAQLGVDIGEPQIVDLYSVAVGAPADAYRVRGAVSAPQLQPA